MVKREEALDTEMAAAEDLFVEVGPSALEFIERVRHGCSVGLGNEFEEV